MPLTINPLTGLPDLIGSAGGSSDLTAPVTVSQPALGEDVLVLQSTAPGSDPSYRVIQAKATTIETVDSTPTPIATITLEDNTVYSIQARMVGRVLASTGGANPGEGTLLVLSILAKRQGGAGAVVGGTQGISNVSENNGGAIDATTSGDDLIIRIQGANVDTTTVWNATIITESVST